MDHVGTAVGGMDSLGLSEMKHDIVYFAQVYDHYFVGQGINV